MKLSNIACAIDCEHDQGRLIEVGLTTIDLTKNEVLTTYSLPVKVDFTLSDEIIELTGWTNRKLDKYGLEKEEIVRRLFKLYGCSSRLIVTDSSPETTLIEDNLYCPGKFSAYKADITVLFHLLGYPSNMGLEAMLTAYGLEFQGTKHRAADDSYNIARLFLKIKRRLNLFGRGNDEIKNKSTGTKESPAPIRA